jgi:hypothetical protein
LAAQVAWVVWALGAQRAASLRIAVQVALENWLARPEFHPIQISENADRLQQWRYHRTNQLFIRYQRVG